MQRLLVSLLAVSLLALAGCNTFKGLGEDIESLGKNIQGSGE